MWPFLTFDPWRRGRTKRSQWTLLISGSRRTIWHLNLWNQLKLKFGPLFDLSLTFDPWRKGRTKRSPWTLLIVGSRRTIWHLNLWNRTKLKIWPLFDLWPLKEGHTKRSHTGRMFNLNRFQRLRCQIVCIELTIKSVHCDLFVWPFLKGSKVKVRSDWGRIFNFNRFQRLRCQIVRLEPEIKNVYCDLFVWPILQGLKVK